MTAHMKNKFLLFPTISSACHYHTDRSLTFLPATLEANEKTEDEKSQYQTYDLLWKRGLLKTANMFRLSIDAIDYSGRRKKKRGSVKKYLYLHLSPRANAMGF